MTVLCHGRLEVLSQQDYNSLVEWMKSNGFGSPWPYHHCRRLGDLRIACLLKRPSSDP